MFARLSISSFLVAFTIGCSSSSSQPSGGTGSLTGPITGDWSVRVETTAASGICSDEVGDVDMEVYSISGSPSALMISTPAGPLSGSLSGQQLTVTGSIVDVDGTTTITATDIAIDDTSFAGTIDWSFTDGIDSCVGRTAITATRISTVPSHAAPTPVLVWHDVEDLGSVTWMAADGAAEVGELEAGEWAELSVPPGEQWLLTETGAFDLVVEGVGVRALRMSELTGR